MQPYGCALPHLAGKHATFWLRFYPESCNQMVALSFEFREVGFFDFGTPVAEDFPDGGGAEASGDQAAHGFGGFLLLFFAVAFGGLHAFAGDVLAGEGHFVDLVIGGADGFVDYRRGDALLHEALLDAAATEFFVFLA